MAEFKDINGKVWNVSLDAVLIKELRATEGVKFDILDDDQFQRLGNDAVLFCDVLFLLCRGQQPGISQEDFLRAIADGDVQEKAEKALEVAYLNFSPPKRRSLLASLRAEQEGILADGIELAKKKVTDGKLRKGFLEKLEAEMDKTLSQILTGPIFVTNSPASSGSAPTG